MLFIISCPGGSSQLVKNELKVLGYPKSQVLSPSTIQCEADESAIAKINLRSRLANKVYLVVGSGTAPTFERLFDIVHRIEWEKYIEEGQPFIVTARTDKSMLTSTPALQSMGKKAISKKLTGNDERREEDETREPVEIMLSLNNNMVQVLLNTTGESLHRRGYRSHTGDAPLKENVAAALIISSGRKFHEPLYDITCGAGTILIEAAMIAKNIAPGLQRYFAFEKFAWYDKEILSAEIKRANEVIIKDKEHTIVGSDMDPTVIAIAKENAENAGVDEYIQLSVQDMKLTRNGRGCYISNPPYGERMNPADLDEIYVTFDQLFTMPDNYGGIVTSYDWQPHGEFDAKTFYNGPDKVTFFKFRKQSSESKNMQDND